MACNSITLANIARDCEANVGGIRKVWLAIWEEGIFQTSGNTDGDIVVSSVTSSVTWYEYNFRKNTGSYESTQTVSDAGNNYYTNTLTMQFSRMEAVKRTAVQALGVGEVAGIVEDCNGKYWTLGFSEPASTTGNSGATGTAKTDVNAYTVVLAAEEAELPYEVIPSVILTLKTGN